MFKNGSVQISGLKNIDYTNRALNKLIHCLSQIKGKMNADNTISDIQFVDTPIDIRDKYQYFTQADTNKLRAAGYPTPFTSLEDGIKEYVTEYLLMHTYF